MALGKEFDSFSNPDSGCGWDFHRQFGQKKGNFRLLVRKGSVHDCILCNWVLFSALFGDSWELTAKPNDGAATRVLHSDRIFPIVLDMERFS